MKANPTTLGPSLFALAEAKEQHKRMIDLHDLIMQLWHHHLSLAKGRGGTSPGYNAEIAARLAFHLGFADAPPEGRRT
jgi:hypothetical protein